MYGDLKTMELYWKQLEHDHSAVDKKVCNRPCFVYAAHLVATTGGASTAVIRDGHDANGDDVIYLSALTSSCDPRRFDPPLYFEKGLFIDVGSFVSSVLIHFLRAKENKPE